MKKIILFCIMVMLLCCEYVGASGYYISCTVENIGTQITIKGKIEGAEQKNRISLLVGTQDNILYIAETESSETGDFDFSFKFPEDTPNGTYDFTIGSDSGVAEYNGILKYNSGLGRVQRQFVDVDLNINISEYIPSINGTISCTEGKQIQLNIVNQTDNTIISNETITSEDGEFNLSCVLPSLLTDKKYDVSILCKDSNNNTLANMAVELDSAVLTLDISGTIIIPQNVKIEGQLKTTNTNLINKSLTFTDSKYLYTTIPNLLPNASLNLAAQVYETLLLDLSEFEESDCIYTADISKDEEYTIFVVGNNISSFTNKNYEIVYNSDLLQPIKLYGTYPHNKLLEGQYQNTEILSVDSGRIMFRITESEIPDGKYWNGTMGIFKFKNISGLPISSKIGFREMQN